MGLDLNKISEMLNRGLAEGATSNGDNKFYKPQAGLNRIRLIYPYNDQTNGLFFLKVLKHFKLGPAKENVVCPRSITYGARCAACDEASRLYKGSLEEIALAKSLQAKTRYLSLVLDMNNVDRGILFYEYGPEIYKQLMEKIRFYGDITDLKTGRDLQITKTGKEILTTYSIESFDPSVLNIDTSKVPTLMSVIELKTSEDIDDILAGRSLVAKDGPLAQAAKAAGVSIPSKPVVQQPVVQQPVVQQPVVQQPVVQQPVAVNTSMLKPPTTTNMSVEDIMAKLNLASQKENGVG